MIRVGERAALGHCRGLKASTVP